MPFKSTQITVYFGRRFIRPMALGLLTWAMVLLLASSSLAQFSLPTDLGQPGSFNAPPEVTRLGSIEVAPVNSPITGEVLFRIASPTVYDRSAADAIPAEAVERRAEEVNARIQRATLHRQDPLMDLATLSIDLATLNDASVITVEDDHYTQPLVLVTITPTDADYHGVPISDLGNEWRDILAAELRDAIQQLSPEQFAQDFIRAAMLLGGLVVLTGLLVLAKFWVKRYQKRLHQRKQELSDPPQPEVPKDPQQGKPQSEPAEQVEQQRHHFLQGLNESWGIDRRLNFLSLLQWLLFWLIVVIWYLGVYRIFNLFPYLEQYSDGILGKPIKLLGIWFFAGLAIRVMRRLIDRFTHEREGFDFGDVLTFGDAQRRQLRISTIAGAAKGLVTVLILSAGLLLALGALGLPTGSVLAIGGIFGLAISFGSQSLVKDLVNGFLILAEDQFAIGDVIDIGEAAGLVETLNLRITRLRSANGELVTIPNSNISQVKNLTRSWSRVNFSIDIAYETDPAKALKILEDLSQQFYDEPEWQDKMLAPPDVLGIDRVSHSGMTITIWIQTAPSQQWAVGREFRLRVRQALAEHNIEIGAPHTYLLEAAAGSENGQQASAESEVIAPG